MKPRATESWHEDSQLVPRLAVTNVRCGQSASGQRLLEGCPLAADPGADKADRGDDGNEQNAEEHSVFDQSRTILVPMQLLNEIPSLRHDSNSNGSRDEILAQRRNPCYDAALTHF